MVENMKKILLIIIFAIVLPFAGLAQTTTTPYDGDITVKFNNYVINGDNITLTSTVDFSKLELSRKMMLEYTPILRSTNTDKEVRFAPVVIAGKQRARIITRAEYFNDYTRAQQPSEIITVKRKGLKSANLSVTVPFEKWVRNSELVLEETCTACCNQNLEYASGVNSRFYTGDSYIFPEPYQPKYEVAYVTPEIEPVKTRSDSYTARLTFQSGKSVLLSNFGDNASVLAEADRTISELRNDPMFTITAITAYGYASPEGNMGTNQKLSDDRARVFVDYLSRTHNLRSVNTRITSRGMGEDWTGLRKAVADASYLDGGQAVLNAIDNISDITRRKTTIQSVNGRRTYNELLNYYYPPLRRNEYTIEYSVRSFNTEEASDIYRTRPELLSLNELFMVASKMKEGSEEFVKVFDYAAQKNPDSPVAQYNRAIAEIKGGNYNHANRYMEKIADNPVSWNGLGIIYWHLGEYDKALEYFRKSADTGNANASANITEYQKWFDDRD